jgi:hypothetical protein
MANRVYISNTPRPLKTLGNLIACGCLIGFFLWTYQKNQIEPTIDGGILMESIITDWKKDMTSIGLDADALIMRVDRIKIVNHIPSGFLNSNSTESVVGRSDHSTRTIWILERNYESFQLKALVYHELGHYLFNLKHIGDDGLIMSTEIKEEPNYYKAKWNSILPIYLTKCKASK